VAFDSMVVAVEEVHIYSSKMQGMPCLLQNLLNHDYQQMWKLTEE